MGKGGRFHTSGVNLGSPQDGDFAGKTRTVSERGSGAQTPLQLEAGALRIGPALLGDADSSPPQTRSGQTDGWGQTVQDLKGHVKVSLPRAEKRVLCK